MTYNDGRDDGDGRSTVFVVVLVLGLIVFIGLCVLGSTWP